MIFRSVTIDIQHSQHSDGYSLRASYESLLNEILEEWKQTEQGKWVADHAFDLHTATVYNVVSEQYIGRIYGRLLPKDLTFYHLKWGDS